MISKTKLGLVEENFAKVKEKLPEYLAEHGIIPNETGKFHCINPDHNENHPSMQIFEHESGVPIARCFSCNFIADIFTAAHILEEKPLNGPSFLHENVKYLADKYDVEVHFSAITEEDLYEINTYSAYRTATSRLASYSYNDKCSKEIARRGWTEDFAKEYNVFCCDNYHDLRSFLKSSGFEARFLDEIDLDNQKIFRDNNLIFTISDEYGNPVGFSARNLDFDPDADFTAPKFINTKTTGLKCNIFKKSERLYAIDIAKKHTSAINPLYIVEGYGDVLSCHFHGMKNCVGVSSADLNSKQLNLLRRLNITDIVICLDGDDTGYKKAKKILDEVLSSVHDLRIRFVFLPWDGVNKIDPDLFIRENGIDAFIALPKVEPFSWRLSEFIKEVEEANGSVTESDSQRICQVMIPIIANEPSPMKRESMLKELHNYSGYSFQVLKEELDKILNAEILQLQNRRKSIIDSLINDLSVRKDGFEIAIERAVNDLEDLSKETNADIFTSDHISSIILDTKSYQENAEMHNSIDFGFNFNVLPVALSGDLNEKLIFMGGTPNTGKSSIFSNLAINLAECNEDVASVILTIDDSTKDYLARIICYDMAKRFYQRGDLDLFYAVNINKVAQPFLFTELPEYQALMQEREYSYGVLNNLVKQGKFMIYDSSYGNSISFLRNIVLGME